MNKYVVPTPFRDLPFHRRISSFFLQALNGVTRWNVSKIRLNVNRIVKSDGKSVGLRRLELIDFCENFENFVEVLCDGARFGTNESLESQYSCLKKRMEVSYNLIKEYLAGYIRPLASDAEQCLNGIGSYGDVFEALYAFDSLEEFLIADDGNMISRITRAREALMRYGDYLRQILR